MRCKIAMLSCTFVIFWSPCICIIILSSQIFYSLKLRFSAMKANNDWPSLTTCNQFHETADPYDCSPWSVSLLKSTNMQKKWMWTNEYSSILFITPPPNLVNIPIINFYTMMSMPNFIYLLEWTHERNCIQNTKDLVMPKPMFLINLLIASEVRNMFINSYHLLFQISSKQTPCYGWWCTQDRSALFWCVCSKSSLSSKKYIQ